MRSEAIASLNVLDSPPEPEFDDLVNLAVLICEVPIAFISLVDRERQWFKARIGFEPCETSLDRSFARMPWPIRRRVSSRSPT